MLDSFDLVCCILRGEWVRIGDGTGRETFISPESLTQENISNFVDCFSFSIFLKMDELMTFSPIFIMFDLRSGYMKF